MCIHKYVCVSLVVLVMRHGLTAALLPTVRIEERAVWAGPGIGLGADLLVRQTRSRVVVGVGDIGVDTQHR